MVIEPRPAPFRKLLFPVQCGHGVVLGIDNIVKNIGMMNKIKIVLVFMALVSAVGAAGAGMGGVKINGKNDVIRVIYDANMQLNALYVNIERGGYDVDPEKTGVKKKIYAVNKVLMDTRDLIVLLRKRS